MYCKYCGKEIANDSVFCQFCGKNLIESISDNKEIESHDDLNLSSENETHNVGTEDKTQEVIIKTKEDSPLHVEISKKKENHSSTIANEIIGNLKMIGLAVILTILYLLVFIAINHKNVKRCENLSQYGASSYDRGIMKVPGKIWWEEHYYEDLHYSYYGYVPHNNIFTISSSSKYIREAIELEKLLELSKDEIDARRSIAQKKADKVLQPFLDDISYIRKNRFQDDFIEHAKYAIIISFILTIIGRYFIKLFRWVNTNKT